MFNNYIKDKKIRIKPGNDYSAGSNISIEDNAINAEGYIYDPDTNSFVAGEKSSATGSNAFATGLNTISSGKQSHAEGTESQATANHSHAEGYRSKATAVYAHAEGNSTEAAANSAHAEGYHCYVGDDYTENTLTAGTNTSSGSYAHAEGNATIAAGVGSHAEGKKTMAWAPQSHAEGNATIASGNQSHTEGYDTKASGVSSHAEGSSTTASNLGAHAEGRNTEASGNASHAEGNYCKATGSYSHAEGFYSESLNLGAHSEGGSSISKSCYSHTEGAACVTGYTDAAPEKNELTAPSNTDDSKGGYAHAEGMATLSIGKASHTEGRKTFASGNYSHAEGNITTSSGTSSHAEGSETKATNTGAHSEGRNTEASGNASHAEGNYSKAVGTHSHAEGYYTESNGNYSHAEGHYSKTNGIGAHAEGANSVAGYNSSETKPSSNDLIAPSNTSDEGGYAHAEGGATLAVGKASHAEGWKTFAFGNYSHAEGHSSESLGNYSHVEGAGNIASGEASHAEGAGNETRNYAQHICGTFATIDTTGETIFQIGVGSDESDRNNAVETTNVGDIYIKGVSGYNGSNRGAEIVKSYYDSNNNIIVENEYQIGSHKYNPATLQQTLPIYDPVRKSYAFQYDETDNSINQANGYYSFVTGYNNKAHFQQDMLQAGNSFVGGDSNNAYHQNTFVFGQGLFTQWANTVVLGNYNNTVPNHNDWSSRVRMIVGGGYKDGENVVSDNIMVLEDSYGGLHIKGGAKTDTGYIGDFGEYFEWFDGNQAAEDRIGYMVQLNGDKIELAQSLENCIGVISGTTSFIAGSCSLDWHGRYMKDEWGRYLKDENGNLIVSPQYISEEEYIPREQRKEWSVVGLIGQILTRQDGTLEVGGYAGCVNGVATKAESGYRVLKIINENIALLLIK